MEGSQGIAAKAVNSPFHHLTISQLHALHVTLLGLLLEVVALVVELFTLGQGNFNLGKAPVVHEQAQGDDGEALVLAFAGQLFQLALVEQQLALAHGVVVVVGTQRVGRDAHLVNPEAAVGVEEAVAVAEVDVAGADAFDFGALQHHARVVAGQEGVLVAGAAVANVDYFRLVVFLGHADFQFRGGRARPCSPCSAAKRAARRARLTMRCPVCPVATSRSPTQASTVQRRAAPCKAAKVARMLSVSPPKAGPWCSMLSSVPMPSSPSSFISSTNRRPAHSSSRARAKVLITACTSPPASGPKSAKSAGCTV